MNKRFKFIYYSMLLHKLTNEQFIFVKNVMAPNDKGKEHLKAMGLW